MILKQLSSGAVGVCALQICEKFLYFFHEPEMYVHELEFDYSFRFLSSFVHFISFHCNVLTIRPVKITGSFTVAVGLFQPQSTWLLLTRTTFGDPMYIICKRAAPFTYFRFAHSLQSIFHILWRAHIHIGKASHESVWLERAEKISFGDLASRYLLKLVVRLLY